MLGKRIAALRHASGLSQSALGKRLGVSPSAVGMYEQGRREPSVDTLVRMAQIFGVTTDYLLTGSSGDACASRPPPDIKISSFTRQELAAMVAAMLTEP